MKFLKLLLFVLLGLALIGCNDEGRNRNDDDNDNDDDIEDVVEPSLRIDSQEYRIELGYTLQLEIEILNSDEELGMIYYSLDDSIASISLTGLVTAKNIGTTKVIAILANYPDQKLEITITVFEVPLDEIRARLDFNYIKQELEKMSDVVDGDIILPYMLRDRMLTWETSDESIINKFGYVYRQDEDVQVTLKATMSYKHIVEVFEKVVTVKRKLPMRDLGTTKVAMAYSRDIYVKREHLEKLDVINYSFATISTTYKFNISSSISTLVRNAHNYGARVVAAVGGGTSDATATFSSMAATKESRKVFIDSMIEAVKQYNLDGIDYDWEYPTYAERDLFSALVRETREALDNYKPGLLLTAAFSAAAFRVNNNYDVKELNKYLDYFNMMTYDYNDWSSGQGVTRHHTNLYTSNIVPTSYSADSAIRAYINGGASPEKIIMGVAAYGRKATNVVATSSSVNGLNARGVNPAQSIRLDEIYNIYYNNPNTQFKLYWDDSAKAAWLFDGSTFISFDNDKSIEAKCMYVFSNNLAGVMYWDYLSDQQGRVVEYMNTYLYKQPKQ